MLVLLVSSQLSRSEQSSSHIFKESSKHLQSLPIASFFFLKTRQASLSSINFFSCFICLVFRSIGLLYYSLILRRRTLQPSTPELALTLAITAVRRSPPPIPPAPSALVSQCYYKRMDKDTILKPRPKTTTYNSSKTSSSHRTTHSLGDLDAFFFARTHTIEHS